MEMPAELQYIFNALKDDNPPGGRFNVLFGFLLAAVIGFAFFSRKWWR
jgi:hypothetical protein